MRDNEDFCRVHQTLRVTPAMEAGLADLVWTLEELVGILEAREAKGREKSKQPTTPRLDEIFHKRLEQRVDIVRIGK